MMALVPVSGRRIALPNLVFHHTDFQTELCWGCPALSRLDERDIVGKDLLGLSHSTCWPVATCLVPLCS